MESNSLYYTGKILTSLLGNDIITKAISEGSNSIYNILYGIENISNDDLNKFLIDIDIKANIKIIECLINNLDPNLKGKAIHLALYQLHDIIIKIREILKQISIKNISHKEKWFHYFRKIDFDKEIIQLNKFNQILDKRLDIFIKVIQIESYTFKK